MKTRAEGRNRTVAVLLLMGLVLSLPAQVTQTKPIKVKLPKVQTEKYRGVVMTWTPVSITVRPRDNFTMVRTFTFTEGLRQKVQNSYMENGDPVTVYLLKGSTSAVKLSGKLRQRDRQIGRASCRERV